MNIKTAALILLLGCSVVHAQTAADCLYLPPSIANRVVFYQGFELPDAKPEIDRISAKVAGTIHLTPDGFAGHGCQSNDPTRHDKPFVIRTARLSPDRPLTVMRWWRVDKAMDEISSFQLLALLGKGHISCFIRGKGEWCALKRPTMFVQVDHFPSISNVNWAVKDDSYFEPGEWHHIAITVGNGSEIAFHLDGSSLVTVHTKGRSFDATDVDTLQAASDSGNFPEHPTTTDEMVVLDRVLSAQEIKQYYAATLALHQMHFHSLRSEKLSKNLR